MVIRTYVLLLPYNIMGSIFRLLFYFATGLTDANS